MDKVDKEAAKYPSRRAAVKSALRYCQEETGWVSTGVVTAVAEYLGLEPIEVYNGIGLIGDVLLWLTA